MKSIQSGEFFELSKLLPENLHGLGSPHEEASFHLALGENSTIKLSSNQAPKKKIGDIQSWTTAFTVYMKIVLDKLPGRAKELVSYLDLIRYAASYHQSLGWLLYDRKFRYKAANDKSLNWGQIDLQLWMRIFTVNHAKLLSEHSLFYNGPSSRSNFGQGIAAVRDDKCSNFNRGRKCAFSPCRYRHVCSQPDCEGPHPSFQCPQTTNGPSSFNSPQTLASPPQQSHLTFLPTGSNNSSSNNNNNSNKWYQDQVNSARK